MTRGFDGQSPEYQKLRGELLEAEIALKEQRERVAGLRRGLPEGTAPPEDYVFREGPRGLSEGDAPVRSVRLSQLFEKGRDTLIVIHAMWAEADELMCPMCTMWADGYDAVEKHVSQRASLVLIAKKEIAELRNYARGRGWNALRLLSSGGTRFNADYGMETPDGGQLPGVSVFSRGPGGDVLHRYTQCAMMAPDHFRGLDALSPVWNLFDLTPEGRGDWMPTR